MKHGYVDLGLPSGTLWATCNSHRDTGTYIYKTTDAKKIA